MSAECLRCGDTGLEPAEKPCIRCRHETPDLSLTLELLGPQLAEIERVLQHSQAGKYAGEPLAKFTALHHMKKATGHMHRLGGFRAVDADTGARHALLAAIRLLMALEVDRQVREAKA